MGFSALGRSRVAGCFLGLAAELGCSSPGSSTRVLGGCLHHWLLPPRVAVPEQALASEFYFFFFFKNALVSCRYSWECGHATPRRGDESR